MNGAEDVILVVLAFSCRDLVDVIVEFTGVVFSVLWMFGIFGWLQTPAGMTMIIGPVLVVGPSVDYGLHVFMRYREERKARSASEDRAGSARGDAPRFDERGAKRPASGATREERSEAEVIREPMVRGLSSVAGTLYTVVTGTGGALLGSTLTSVRTCALLSYPHPQIRSFCCVE